MSASELNLRRRIRFGVTLLQGHNNSYKVRGGKRSKSFSRITPFNIVPESRDVAYSILQYDHTQNTAGYETKAPGIQPL